MYSKLLKTCLAVAFVTTALTGCAKYSMPQAKPYENKQAFPTSEPDTKIFLTQKVNDVISASTGISSMIILYQEDSIKPTEESKASLLHEVNIAIGSVDKNITYLTSFTPAHVYEAKRNDIVRKLEVYKEVLIGIEKSVSENNFKALKQYTAQFNSIMSALQTASL